jgi:hypothetical protein
LGQFAGAWIRVQTARPGTEIKHAKAVSGGELKDWFW